MGLSCERNNSHPQSTHVVHCRYKQLGGGRGPPPLDVGIAAPAGAAPALRAPPQLLSRRRRRAAEEFSSDKRDREVARGGMATHAGNGSTRAANAGQGHVTNLDPLP